ncbi:hypothetical protein BDY19DRAFT_630700 [Irpex rosettiformis]|uniref:Uncharacterized protein n=1 Tax=Irpex rosettiformis TaxID=378272 RepID=A0ACB8UBG5_9APHY|nr:hypothetical protein BDY19DRAFT_630700 [Irpex rosettiformis]
MLETYHYAIMKNAQRAGMSLTHARDLQQMDHPVSWILYVNAPDPRESYRNYCPRRNVDSDDPLAAF